MTLLRLPANLDAERYCLGSVLLDGDQMHGLRQSISADDFSLEANRRIWTAMCEFYDAGGSVDRVTVANALQQTRQLESVGGVTYLCSLDDGLPDIADLSGYVRILKDKAILRRVIRTCVELSNRAQSDTEPVQQILDAAQRFSMELVPADGNKDPISIGDFLAGKSLDDVLGLCRSHGVELPWPALEHYLCGLQSGQLIVLAGHTSTGKTSFALQVSAHVAKQGRAVIFFSREMEKQRLFRRMVNQVAVIDADKLRHGALDSEDRARQATAARWLNDAPIYMDEKSATIPAIHAGVRRIKMQAKIGLVVVDYLQRLVSVGRFGSRAQEVGAMSREMKQMAGELSVPVLLLSQFSRPKEDRDPELHDLKESGDIENDADVALLICPERKCQTPQYHPVKIRIAKQREGPRNVDIPLIWRPNCQRFESAETR